MSYSAIIIDDESDARLNIRTFTEQFCPEINFIGEAESVRNAVPLIDSLKPQLLFLDIQLGDGTGFEILENVKHQSKVIFTTAYDQYAIKAFKVKAIDYILKPINPLELQKAVNSATTSISEHMELNQLKKEMDNSSFDKIGIPVKGKIELQKLESILRLESESNYTKIFLKDGSNVVVAKTLKMFEEILIKKHFIRVHKSHLVNFRFVAKLDQKNNILHLTNNEQIPVSRRYKSLITNAIGMKIT